MTMVKLSGAALCVAVAAGSAQAGYLFVAIDGSGLAAEAEFTLLNPTTLQVRYRNLSVGAPGGFSNADQILSGVSWDFGHPGYNGDTAITGGSVVTGPTSSSLNFSISNVGPNADVSGEFGYGNMDGTGALTNFVTSNTAVATPFGGANLDGPVSIDGPQGGLVANPAIVPLGGLGAIQDEVIATVSLSIPYTDGELLTDLLGNGVRFEFGSDAAFLTGGYIPTPGAGSLLIGAGALLARRRRA